LHRGTAFYGDEAKLDARLRAGKCYDNPHLCVYPEGQNAGEHLLASVGTR